MRGQVIDGLYKGCEAMKLENHTLCIRDQQGQTIPVTQNSAQSVTDISHNYPGFGAKTYMVRWKQDAVSILQFFPEQIPDDLHSETSVPTKPGRRAAPIALILAAVVLCGALAAAWFTGLLHMHSWAEATCETPRTCTDCGETEGEALGHAPDNWTVLKKASYGGWGTERQVCLDCGEELGQRRYLPDAYTDSLYVCSSDEFLQRLNLWLREAGYDWTTELFDEEGEMLYIKVMDGDTILAIVCFVNKDYTTVMGDGPGRLNASSICVAFQEWTSEAEARLLPVMVACCNNDLDLTEAGALADEIRAGGKFEKDGVRYHWGRVDGLDYLFLGFDSVPDSLDKLPEVGSSNDDTTVETGSILFYPDGSRRNAADFADEYRNQTAPLADEYGYGTLQCDFLSSFTSYAYAIRKQGMSEYTVLAFANGGDLITANGAFDEIYMVSPMDNDDQVEAFAFHTAAMVHLVDPGMGDLAACASFLNEMTGELDDGNSVLKEVNGITYYMSLKDDGYVSLVISF